jgi:small subunit ribosomal protein S8
MKDNVSDMLTRIRNGQKANLNEILLFWPTPNFCIKLLTVFQQEGFIRGFKKIIINEKKYILVLLKYTELQNPVIRKIERISKPGKRTYISSNNLWKLNNGKGVLILSTPQGLMTDIRSRRVNLGGELICYIE